MAEHGGLRRIPGDTRHLAAEHALQSARAELSQAIAELASEPTLKARYLEIGAIIKPTTPKETADFAERERVKWKEVVRISGAKLD